MSVGNTKYGDGALEKNINGSNNSAFGICSSRDIDVSWNTSVGAYSNMSNVSGISNVAVGTNAHLLNVSGSYNTALGTATLLNNKANSNTAVGSNSMEKNNTGKENVAIGVQTGYENTTGEKNVFVGSYAGFNNLDGSENIFLGNNSGFNVTNNSSSSSKNSFLGANTGVANNTKIYNRSTAIGYGSIVDASNQIMLGTNNDNVVIPGNAYLTNVNPNYTEQSIVSKKYVDTYVSGGIRITQPCYCATTTDISLTGLYVPSSIDDYTLVDGNRVLVRCQNSSNNVSIPNVNNGIYEYHYNNPFDVSFTRTNDCSGNDVKGQATFIRNGTLNKSFIFVQTNYDGVTNEAIAGIYPLEYIPFQKIEFSIGNGLEIIGNTLQVKDTITNTAGDPYLTDVGILGKLSVGGDSSFNSTVDVSGTFNVLNTDAYINNVRVGRGGVNLFSNTVVGKDAGLKMTNNGSENVFIGYESGLEDLAGSFNTFVGYYTGRNNATGNSNSFVGKASGALNTTGQENTFLGASSGYNNLTGSNNVYLGNSSGFNAKGNNNVSIGDNADTSGNINNSIAIGSGVKVDVSNTIILGNPSQTTQIQGTLHMTNVDGERRRIFSSKYNFYDLSGSSLTDVGTIYNKDGIMYIYNNKSGGSMNFFLQNTDDTQNEIFQLFENKINLNNAVYQVKQSPLKNYIQQSIINADVSTNPNNLKYTNISYYVDPSLDGTLNPALIIEDSNSGNSLYFIPNSGLSSWSPLSSTNSQTIIGRGPNQNNASLVLASYSTLKNGIKIISNSSSHAQTELWAGNDTSIILNNTTGISLTGDVSMNNKLKVTGDASFNSNVDISGTLIVKNSDSYINGLTVGKGKNSNALNTVIGVSAGASLINGNNNTFVGYQSGLSVTSGESNSFFGYLSGNNNLTGSENVAIGMQSLAGGSNNLRVTCIGYRSGHLNNNGSSTTSIGHKSGYYNNGGNFNTYLGSDTDLINDGAIVFGYSTAIGYNAKIDASNTIVMGTSTETTKIPGKLNVLLDASFNSNVNISGILTASNIGTVVTGILTTGILTTGTLYNAGNVSLPAGTWIININASIEVTSTTTVNKILACPSTQNNLITSTYGLSINDMNGQTCTSGTQWVLTCSNIYTPTSITSYYLLIQCVFGTTSSLNFNSTNSRFEAIRIK